MILSFSKFNESESYTPRRTYVEDYPYVMRWERPGTIGDMSLGREKFQDLLDIAREMKLDNFAIYSKKKNPQIRRQLKNLGVASDDDRLVCWYDKTGKCSWTRNAEQNPNLFKKSLDPFKNSNLLRTTNDKIGVFEN